MRLFGLNILTDKEHSELMCKYFREGEKSGYENAKLYYRNIFKVELLRLKEDHWDKLAFIRLLDLLESK